MKFQQRHEIAKSVFEREATGALKEHFASADPAAVPPLVLAYVGDAVFHLFVRTRLLSYVQSPVDVVSQFGAKIVSAVSQAHACAAIAPMLTEEEKAIFRRGRNAHSRTPRSATVGEYHASTGFEALLGALYLKQENDRLRELSEAAFQAIAADMARP